MKRVLSFCLVLLLCGCQGGNSIRQSQNISNSNTGSVTQKNTGSISDNRTQDISPNIALDPAAFSSVFGAVKSVTNPSNAKLGELKDIAESTPDKAADIANAVAACEKAGSKCILEPR